MSQITTHILDTTRGKPAVAVPIALFQQQGNEWLQLGAGKTNQDGRIADLLANDVLLAAGVYRMHFDTNSYFNANDESGFYPFVDIVFEINGDGEHYHIPLLLTAYGYSTYRGS
ncbi:MAG: hydroxyisourate hydrolase [Gammaproteobacteria bacterium]|nr:MAG: hydroxyisourate hydrolase [Gammaproteobacteria bacterium]